MATATRKLFVNLSTGTLQVSDKNGGPFQLPQFTKYETIPYEIVIVEPDLEAVGPNKFSRVPIANLSLTVSMNDTLDDASPLVQQASWTKDSIRNVFSGELSLNTAGMNSHVGSAASVNAYFEIKFGEGTSAPVVYLAQVTVRNAVTQPVTTSPTPITELLTKAEAEQQYVRQVMGAGQTITFTTPDGLDQRVLGAGNGGISIDQWFTV